MIGLGLVVVETGLKKVIERMIRQTDEKCKILVISTHSNKFVFNLVQWLGVLGRTPNHKISFSVSEILSLGLGVRGGLKRERERERETNWSKEWQETEQGRRGRDDSSNDKQVVKSCNDGVP